MSELSPESINVSTWKIPSPLGIIGSHSDGEFNGMTASWITQVSMDPALIGVGIDNIDTEYCYSKKIRIQPATGMNAHSVAEYVGACSLFLIKKISLFNISGLNEKMPILIK